MFLIPEKHSITQPVISETLCFSLQKVYHLYSILLTSGYTLIGLQGGGKVDHPFAIVFLKRKKVFKKMSYFYIVINLSGPIKSYLVKINHFGSVVSEILWYRETEILLFYYKD